MSATVTAATPLSTVAIASVTSVNASVEAFVATSAPWSTPPSSSQLLCYVGVGGAAQLTTNAPGWTQPSALRPPPSIRCQALSQIHANTVDTNIHCSRGGMILKTAKKAHVKSSDMTHDCCFLGSNDRCASANLTCVDCTAPVPIPKAWLSSFALFSSASFSLYDDLLFGYFHILCIKLQTCTVPAFASMCGPLFLISLFIRVPACCFCGSMATHFSAEQQLIFTCRHSVPSAPSSQASFHYRSELRGVRLWVLSFWNCNESNQEDYLIVVLIFILKEIFSDIAIYVTKNFDKISKWINGCMFEGRWQLSTICSAADVAAGASKLVYTGEHNSAALFEPCLYKVWS